MSKNKPRHKRRKKTPASFTAWCAACFAADAADAGETWRYLPHLLVAAFIARAGVALAGDFSLHPDEIMQYLEPAHYAVFGGGVLHWEYVYGARSWIIPGFVAAILFALDAIGLARPAVYVPAVELAFCAVSLLLPWAMYVFTRRAFHENAARLALIFGCFWYEFVVMAHKPMSEFISTPVLFVALACIVGGGVSGRRILFAAGMLLAFSAALRFQYAPVVLLLLALRSLTLQRKQIFALWGGAAVLTALVGVLEWLTWGAPFHSYLMNFLVNYYAIFDPGPHGLSSPWILLAQLFAASAGVSLLVFALGMKIPGAARLLMLLCAVTLLLHMLPAHKEYRFIFLLIPCWLILLAVLLAHEKHSAFKRRGYAGALLIYGAVATASIFPWQPFVHIAFTNLKPVHYLRHQEPMFAVMKFLAAQDDVRGVFYRKRSYHATGGYYHLHHEVPFYTPDTHSGPLSPLNKINNPPLNTVISHIVITDEVEITLFDKVFSAGNLNVWKNQSDAPLLQWREPVVRPGSEEMNTRIAAMVKRLRGTPLGWFLADRHWLRAPPMLEFIDDAGGD